MGRPWSKCLSERDNMLYERQQLLQKIKQLMNDNVKKQEMVQRSIDTARKLMESNDVLIRAMSKMEIDFNAKLLGKW